MASVNARDGALFFDFRYRGTRCREYTKLPDTIANRKRMQKVLDKIERAIAAGTFHYADFFPSSKLAAKFDGNGMGIPTHQVAATQQAGPASSDAPLFRTYIEEWFTEFTPTWRASHIATLRSTLNLHLIPYFGDMPVGSITKSDILQFRAEIAQRKGRGGNETLSAKTIIHLHGMWSEVESPDGEFQVRKQTVNVQPAQRVTYRVKADALGRWAYHCHLLYHMEAGMFRVVVVA